MHPTLRLAALSTIAIAVGCSSSSSSPSGDEPPAATMNGTYDGKTFALTKVFAAVSAGSTPGTSDMHLLTIALGATSCSGMNGTTGSPVILLAFKTKLSGAQPVSAPAYRSDASGTRVNLPTLEGTLTVTKAATQASFGSASPPPETQGHVTIDLASADAGGGKLKGELDYELCF